MILFEALFFSLVSLPALSSSGSKNIVTSENSVYNSTCWTQTIRTCKPLSDSKGHSVNLAGNSLSEPPALYEDCYPWMFRNESSGACECSDIPYRAVLCDPTIPLTYILDCYCMTYNSALNETELGRCLSGCGHKDDIVYYKLPQNKENLNSFSCSKVNRDSPLCGKCRPGYSPLVYSYDMYCMNCTDMDYNWIKYIAVAYIPLTFFFFFVIIFKFSGTSPLVRGFITVCQGLVAPIGIRAALVVAKRNSYSEVLLRLVGMLYGIWNLDFFRTVIPPICLNISPLQALALDYAVAFYPLVLVLITHVLISLHSHDIRIVVWSWKPFQRFFRLVKKDWDIQGSVIQAFATFFMLSYLKILNVTVDLLVFTEKYILPSDGQHYHIKHALYYDASVEYFQGDHLYYGISAIFIGIVMGILPLVFLVVYPMRWFQKCLNRLHIQRQSIDTLVNCYQGYYKDGTDGTRDYRIFSVVFFCVQITVMILYTFSKSIFTYPVAAMIILLYIFAILTVQPYKEQFKAYTTIDAYMLLTIAMVFIMTSAADDADIKAVEFSTPSYIALAAIEMAPTIYLVGLIVWWIFVKNRVNQKLPCIQIRKESYNTNDFPDRIEHPQSYQPENTPMINSGQENRHHNMYYGAAASP